MENIPSEIINSPPSVENKTEIIDTREKIEQKREKKQPLDVRILRKVLSPERTTEFLASQVMMQLEIIHDMQLYPKKYGLSSNQIGNYLIPENPPAAKWAMDHIGDIWEISAGFTAMRVGFVALNEVLKKEPIKKLTHGFQVSDEAAFWASLMTTWTVKAVHSMGWISLFHIHDHMDNPVPEMIFGQGVAAAVLVATHYAAKYREPLKNLAIKFGKNIVEGSRTFGQRLNESKNKIDEFMLPNAPDTGVDLVKETDTKEVFK